MDEDHLVVRTDPGRVLQASSIEGDLINPDEAGVPLHQSSEEALEDLPIAQYIRAVGLVDSELRLGEGIAQVFPEDLVEPISGDEGIRTEDLADLAPDHRHRLGHALHMLQRLLYQSHL